MTIARYQIELTDGNRRRGHVVTTFSIEAARMKAEQRAAALGRDWAVISVEEIKEAA